MNYFALFLDGENYIEKCLILIKHISNPKSKSMPHITLRFFKENDPKTDYIDYLTQKKISYLNIIGPGTFNLEKEQSSYVVFLRCESEELEEIDYRPDFPFSRLHITLYEGTDRKYAKSLYNKLAKYRWHIRVTFDAPKSISKNTIGVKVPCSFDYDRACQYVLGDSHMLSNVSQLHNNQKLNMISSILKKLSQRLERFQTVDPIYVNDTVSTNDENFIKNSEIMRIADNRYFTPEFPDGIVELDVEDKKVTSPEYARDMAACALELFGDDSKEIHFGDSAIGTGALFIAIKRLTDIINQEQNKQYTFGSSIGVDIDIDRAQEAYLRCSTRNLQVILDDALSPKTNLGSPRNMMLVNPPYTRSSSEHIPTQYRSCLKQWAKDITDIDIPGRAGLFVYHLLIMHKWLADDGVAVWLLPTFFFQTKYGEAVREYLTRKVQLLRMHIYNEKTVQFEKTNIATTVVAFRNCTPNAKTMVKITWGDSMEQPLLSAELSMSKLQDNVCNWRNLIFDTLQKKEFQDMPEIKFSDMFDIKRGLATGANSFFVISREEAKKHGIPEVALKPILPKSRYLKSLIVHDRGDGYPDVNPLLSLIDCSMDESMIRANYPKFYDYLQQAKKKVGDGKAIVDRTLVKSRSPWYKQELREPPLFLLTYMGREKSDLPPLYFILNRSKAVALNTYILLYPKPWLDTLLKTDETLCVDLLKSLNKTAKHIIAHRTRVYSGGLKKIEPNELKPFPIIDLPMKISDAYKK